MISEEADRFLNEHTAPPKTVAEVFKETLQAKDSEAEKLRDERDKAQVALCKWRSAIQNLTPQGSEFMSVEVVADWARQQKTECCQAKMEAAKLRARIAELEVNVRTARNEVLICIESTAMAILEETQKTTTMPNNFIPTDAGNWMNAVIHIIKSIRALKEVKS